MFGAALTTAGGFAVLNLSALLPLRLFGQAFVVAIALALLSSLLILPAFYSPFLKRTANATLKQQVLNNVGGATLPAIHVGTASVGESE